MAGERKNWARWSVVSLIACVLWLQTNAQGKRKMLSSLLFSSSSNFLILTSVAVRCRLHNATSISDKEKHCILLLKILWQFRDKLHLLHTQTCPNFEGCLLPILRVTFIFLITHHWTENLLYVVSLTAFAISGMFFWLTLKAHSWNKDRMGKDSNRNATNEM